MKVASTQAAASPLLGRTGALPASETAPPLFDMIELMFFAYRDFVGDADRLLEDYGFGRAHHRVLHFVSRHPGLTVAELLDILKITKQSLNRVMKDLLDGGFVLTRAGLTDRRQRLLFPTPRGRALALELANVQSERFRAALADAAPGAVDEVRRFLLAMVDPLERGAVETMIRPDSQALGAERSERVDRCK